MYHWIAYSLSNISTKKKYQNRLMNVEATGSNISVVLGHSAVSAAVAPFHVAAR